VQKFVTRHEAVLPEFLEGSRLASGGTRKIRAQYNLIYRGDMPKSDRSVRSPGLGLRT
jgi:hypothetical protein